MSLSSFLLKGVEYAFRLVSYLNLVPPGLKVFRRPILESLIQYLEQNFIKIPRILQKIANVTLKISAFWQSTFWPWVGPAKIKARANQNHKILRFWTVSDGFRWFGAVCERFS